VTENGRNSRSCGMWKQNSSHKLIRFEIG